LVLKCSKSNLPISIYHHIYDKNNKLLFFVDEIAGKIINKNFSFSSKVEYLSDYMTAIIKNIIVKKSCSLPKFFKIYLEHADVIESLRWFYNVKYKKNIKNINIT
jgi:hypothetical protein